MAFTVTDIIMLLLYHRIFNCGCNLPKNITKDALIEYRRTCQCNDESMKDKRRVYV